MLKFSNNEIDLQFFKIILFSIPLLRSLKNQVNLNNKV